jgi:hypothetical protein
MKGKSVLLLSGMEGHKGMVVLYPKGDKIMDHTIIKDGGKRRLASTYSDGYITPWQQLMTDARRTGIANKLKEQLFSLVSDEDVVNSDMIDHMGMPFVRVAIQGDEDGFEVIECITTMADRVVLTNKEYQVSEEEALSAADSMLKDIF